MYIQFTHPLYYKKCRVSCLCFGAEEARATHEISTHDTHPIPTFQQIDEASAGGVWSSVRSRRCAIETVRVPGEVIYALGGHALVTLHIPPLWVFEGERGGKSLWVFQVIVIWEGRGRGRGGSEDGSFEP